MSISEHCFGSEQDQSQPIEIRTPDGELVLQQYTPQDAQEAFDLIDRNRKHLSQHGDETAGKYSSVETFTKSITDSKNPHKLRFGIRNKDGDMIGSINLTPDDEDDFSRSEIGYYMGEEYTGHGYMTRAVEALTSYAFETLGSKEVYGDTHKDNPASARVLEKAGYIQSDIDGDYLVFTKRS